ncbi:MAG: HD domain-containing protein [Defluviitaleaceae bacterium]|nr:HD domain-containing protein [Defluviitaleaceae bacterium]
MNSEHDKPIKIRDPIYGFIELDSQEKEIINNKYFQRLRRIKQLSLTEMVYPGACHTRFEHSLGVMQMASDMFDNLVKHNRNKEILKLDQYSIKRTKKILRIAALLHDIGHSPFSHAGENTMELLPEGHLDLVTGTEKYDHEHYSKAAIKFLFRDIIEDHPLVENYPISVDEVLLLLGDKTVRLRGRGNLMILKELISGQFDADRADYLLRDSLHLGVNYGIYDKSRLISCVTLGESETGSFVLAIEEGGLNIAESLVIARYQMFSQVYFHKVRRIFDYHVSNTLSEILKYLGLKNGIFLPPTSKENMIKYFEFDDWSIQGLLKDGKGGKHGDHILCRTPYKKIAEWRGDMTESIENEIKSYENKYSGKNYFLDKNVSTKWYKLDKDIIISSNETEKYYPLSMKSQLIKAIGQPNVTRFYVAREDL